MAHELGHWLLHRDLLSLNEGPNFQGVDDNKAFRSTKQGNFFNTKITTRHEREANQFAAVLLMPKDLVLKHHKLNFERYTPNRAFQCLYHYFRVSPAALRWRCKALGLRVD